MPESSLESEAESETEVSREPSSGVIRTEPSRSQIVKDLSKYSKPIVRFIWFPDNYRD